MKEKNKYFPFLYSVQTVHVYNRFLEVHIYLKYYLNFSLEKIINYPHCTMLHLLCSICMSILIMHPKSSFLLVFYLKFFYNMVGWLVGWSIFIFD